MQVDRIRPQQKPSSRSAPSVVAASAGHRNLMTVQPEGRHVSGAGTPRFPELSRPAQYRITDFRDIHRTCGDAVTRTIAFRCRTDRSHGNRPLAFATVGITGMAVGGYAPSVTYRPLPWREATELISTSAQKVTHVFWCFRQCGFQAGGSSSSSRACRISSRTCEKTAAFSQFDPSVCAGASNGQ